MTRESDERLSRRDLMRDALVAGAAAAVSTQGRRARAAGPTLEAGEGVVDTTPPLKVEMGGFHRPPGQERRVEGIRHKMAARALVLRVGQDQAATVSLDIAAVSAEFSAGAALRVKEATATPAERWLDTTVHALRFERSGAVGRKLPDLVWCHF